MFYLLSVSGVEVLLSSPRDSFKMIIQSFNKTSEVLIQSNVFQLWVILRLQLIYHLQMEPTAIRKQQRGI